MTDDNAQPRESEISENGPTTEGHLGAELPKAIEDGDVDRLRDLLRRPGAVETRFDYVFPNAASASTGVTPLVLAAFSDDIQAVEEILRHGARVNTGTANYNLTALHMACLCGHLRIVERLVQQQANIEIKTKDKESPLNMAAQFGHQSVCDLLIKAGANIESAEKDGRTPLLFASANQHVEVAELLIRKGANVNVQSKVSQSTSLHHWARRGNRRMVSLLLENRAKIDTPDATYCTALHIAAWNEHAETVSLLLAKKASLKKVDEDGWTPLHYASRAGNLEVTVLLLDKGASVKSETKVGVTALHLASLTGNIEVTKLLLAKGASVRKGSEKGLTALHAAALGGNSEVASLLIENGAGVDRLNDDGSTPLRLASEFGHTSVVELLLSRGATVDNASSSPPKGLYDAASNGHIEVVELLFRHGARVGKMDHFKPTLEEQLIEKTKIDNEDWSLLHFASAKGYFKVVGFLLRNNPDITKTDDNGNTALHLASEKGRANVVQLLLDRAATESHQEVVKLILRQNDNKRTCLQVAIDRGYRGVQQVILDSLARPGPGFLRSSPKDAEQLLELAAESEIPGHEHALKHMLDTWGEPPKVNSAKWTALDWAVYRSQAIPVWWILSKGGHLHGDKIRNALRVAKDRSHRGTMDSLVTELLHNPPPILGEDVDNRDNDNPPVLPRPPQDVDEFLGLDGTIIDFYTNGEKIDFHFKEEKVEDLIYEKGPEKVMSEARKNVCYKLDILKERMEKARIEPQGTTGREKDLMQSKNPSGMNSDPLKGETKGIEHLKRVDSVRLPGDHLFRWIHLPVNNMPLAEDLVTRISIDSGRTQKEHRPLADFFSNSWAQLNAGGGQRYMKPNCVSQGSDVMDDRKIALYMPYLTVDDKEIREDRSDNANSHIPQSNKVMTLDQYYYVTANNTENRDCDQVISRYIKRKREEWITQQGTKKKKHANQGALKRRAENENKDAALTKILVVDQLWLWICDNNTIITATTHDFKHFVDMVYEALVFEESRGGFKQPTCVMSMMELILGIATGPFMRKASFEGNKVITKEAMEIFRESIRYVADSEIQLFNSFENSLDPMNNKNGNGSNEALNPWHNLHEETKFLREIKDIQDELKILRTLAEAQETVWNQTFDDDHFKDRSICTPISVKAEVDRMIEEADKTHDSINTLLDLKQKQAGMTDAQLGHEQNRIVTVFTVVTIVFLPLSFLTSVFALNISDFPHVGNNIEFEGWWIFPIIFGTSIGVSFLFLFFAFNVNTLNKYYQALMHQGHRGRFIQDFKARVLPKKRKSQDKQTNHKVQKPPKETKPAKTSALERKISPSEKEKETKYEIESRGPGKEMIKAFQFLDPLRSRKKHASPSDPELGF